MDYQDSGRMWGPFSPSVNWSKTILGSSVQAFRQAFCQPFDLDENQYLFFSYSDSKLTLLKSEKWNTVSFYPTVLSYNIKIQYDNVAYFCISDLFFL